MVYYIQKKVNGKKYTYASKTIRIGKKVISISKRADKKKETPALSKFFKNKEEEIRKKHLLKKYKSNSVFTTEQIIEIEEMKSNYNNLIKQMTEKQRQDLFDRFNANFTFESNALEGNSLTLKDVNMILYEQKTIKGKDLREIYETKNSRKVLDLILNRKINFNEKGILKMHSILIKDMGIPKGYKKFPNFLLGRQIKTTPPEEVKKEIKNLLKNTKSSKLHPLQTISHFHSEFEKIHPFEDGNGRVGRFLIVLYLIKNNYPPLIIRKSQRIAYLKALEDYDRGYKDNMERFILEKYKKTFRNFFEIYIKYL